MNLQGLLVQSPKWFDISSVQLSSLVTSLSVKFVQFSSGQGGGGQVPPLHLFSSVRFTNSSALTRIDLAGSVRLSLISVHQIVWEEQSSISSGVNALLDALKGVR